MDLLPFGPRMDRFDEACDVILGLLTQPVFDYQGEHFPLAGAYCEPKPVQQPHPPICIGGTRRAPHAAHRGPGGPALEPTPRVDRGVHPAAGRAGRALRGPRPRPGRDHRPRPTCGSTRPARSIPGALAADAAAWAEAGLDLGIVYFHAPYDPAVLEPVAKALAPLTE